MNFERGNEIQVAVGSRVDFLHDLIVIFDLDIAMLRRNMYHWRAATGLECFMKSHVASGADNTAAPPALFQRIWPSAALGCGLALSAAWAILLGYELVTLIGLTLKF
jgi:hypothetical protein